MTATLSRKPARNSSCGEDRQAVVCHRAQALVESPIDFVPANKLECEDAESADLVGRLLAEDASRTEATASQSGAVGRMGEKEVLTHQEEAALFRHMNHLKCRAYALRETLDPEKCSLQEVREIETLLAQAQRVRDHIIECNLRLVMALAKKFVSQHASFDDLMSDGAFTLMKAVEKFDYERGFRFSTYAYRSIAREAYRTVTSAARAEARTTRDAEDWAFEQQEAQASTLASDQAWSNVREVMTGMLDHLDRRERFIVRSRYALGSHRKSRSFRYLGDKLGVSKERARQLEKRAVDKLRAMAGNMDLDELFGASLA